MRAAMFKRPHASPLPPPPPNERTLWVLRRGFRVTRAVVRLFPHGRELRLLVGEELAWSRLFRDDAQGPTLNTFAEHALRTFTSCGWTRWRT